MIWLAGAVVAALLLAAWWVRNADHRDARHRADLGDETWSDTPWGDV